MATSTKKRGQARKARTRAPKKSLPDMCVRIYPPNRRLGFYRETFTLSGSRYPKFKWQVGWYTVDAKTAERLGQERNNPNDPTSRPVFEVCTLREAKALDRAEKAEKRRADDPVPLPKGIRPSRVKADEENARVKKAIQEADDDEELDLSDEDDDWGEDEDGEPVDLTEEFDEEDEDLDQDDEEEDDLDEEDEDLDDLIDEPEPAPKKVAKKATKKKVAKKKATKKKVTKKKTTKKKTGK